MPLTDDEKATLDTLLKKQEEPEPKDEKTGIGRVLNVNLDLSDDAQIEKAIGFGLLERIGGDDDEDDDADDEAPRRRGFFPEK